jgi:hypothetical protein
LIDTHFVWRRQWKSFFRVGRKFGGKGGGCLLLLTRETRIVVGKELEDGLDEEGGEGCQQFFQFQT